MWDIYLDADNIPIDHYLSDIAPIISQKIYPYPIEEIVPKVYSQTNLVIKYESCKTTTLDITCCKTTNRNATDARIIYNVGISVSSGNKVIIVSNDKIFKELEDDEGVFVIDTISQCNVKKVKLRKRTIIAAINDIKKDDESKDVYLCDMLGYFPSHSMSKLREFINSLSNVKINTNECVYIT